LPDIEQRFHLEYADQGLDVVALNSRDTLEQIGEVLDFVENLGVTYDVGLEDDTTTTYSQLAQNFEGLNPFPLTVLLGKDGTIRYIAREYDGDALTAAIEAALAE
jgi:hypothetical protein